MATPGQRKEIAEKLREAKEECNQRDYPWMIEDLIRALGFLSYEDADDQIFDRLANLIDPTCNDFGGEEGPNGEGYDFACSACGWCGDVCEPNYCPNCGARVVDYVDGGGE